MYAGVKDFPWGIKELVHVRYKEMDLLPFARSLFVGKLSRGGVARRVWSDPVTMANEDGRSESRRDARAGQVSVLTGRGWALAEVSNGGSYLPVGLAAPPPLACPLFRPDKRPDAATHVPSGFGSSLPPPSPVAPNASVPPIA